jgi:hypothetical protein
VTLVCVFVALVCVFADEVVVRGAGCDDTVAPSAAFCAGRAGAAIAKEALLADCGRGVQFRRKKMEGELFVSRAECVWRRVCGYGHVPQLKPPSLLLHWALGLQLLSNGWAHSSMS